MVDFRCEMSANAGNEPRGRRTLVPRGRRSNCLRAGHDAAVAEHAHTRRIVRGHGCRFALTRLVGTAIRAKNRIRQVNRPDQNQRDCGDEPTHTRLYVPALAESSKLPWIRGSRISWSAGHRSMAVEATTGQMQKDK